MTDLTIAGLIERLIKGTITRDEKELLADWIQRSGNTEDLASMLGQYWKDFEPGQSIPADKAGQLLQSILRKAKGEEEKQLELTGEDAAQWERIGEEATQLERLAEQTAQLEIPDRQRVIPIRSYQWFRLVAAVMTALILLGTGVVYFITKHQADPKPLTVVKADVAAPSVSNAVLTLANGKMIDLDSVDNGSLCMQGKTAVVKLGDGDIAYRAKDAGESMEYNTLTVPRGSRIAHIALSDGTKVWLNAGSSLKYPVAFAGRERVVSVTGETYFEVAHAANTPFMVRKGSVTISVLGTHFNVNAYEDEADMKVTLLEGAVVVASSSGKISLQPGQMASINHDQQIGLTEHANVEETIAWKNGVFQFASADIRTVMRELSRWYGLELDFKDEIREKFHVEMNRNTNISDVFKILETTGAVHFRVEGNKVTIMR